MQPESITHERDQLGSSFPPVNARSKAVRTPCGTFGGPPGPFSHRGDKRFRWAHTFWWGARAGRIHRPGPQAGAERQRAKAATLPPSHNPGASSSATISGTGSTSSPLSSLAGATGSSITALLPSLFASPLTTTVPPAASAARSAQSAVVPFGPSTAPAPARSFGQSLLVSEQQVPQSGHLGQQDDLGDSKATGSAIDEKKQAGPFIKIIEKPKADGACESS